MNTVSKKKYYLTGADAFILALENHNHLKGSCGNACRYVLELNGHLNVESFEKKINQNKNVQWLSSLVLQKNNFFSTPYWEEEKVKKISISIFKNNDSIPDEIFSRQFILNQTSLLSFDVIQRDNNTSCLIFSWHHLLMDSYGATLLLRSIENKITLENSFTNESKTLSFSNIKQVVKAKFFVDKTSKRPLSKISKIITPNQVHQKIKILNFSEEETKEVEKKAIANGVKFGNSPFYLASTAQSVKHFLMNSQHPVENFWIPVPQSIRKKGSVNPILGNQLSFLFYRLEKNNLASLKENTAAINHQMLEQMRKGMPQAYFTLLDFFKRAPTKLYYKLIQGRRGKNLASFLFTLAEEHPNDLVYIENIEVKQAYSLPPNNFQPGLTFAFMKFKSHLQIMILYYEEIFSEQEANLIFTTIKQNLLGAE